MIKKIVLGCCIGICSLNASSSNVASLTDLKEAVHFLLKDYKEQTKKIEALESRLNIVDGETKRIAITESKLNKVEAEAKRIATIESKLNKVEAETKRIANLKLSNTPSVNKNSTNDLNIVDDIGSEDDRLILDYIKERTISK